MTTTLTMAVAIGSSAMACGSGSMVPTTPITIADGCACGLSTLEARIGGSAITTASATSRSGFQKAPLLRGFSPRPSALGASWSLLELSGLASQNYQHLSPRRRNDGRLSVITSTTFLSSILRHGLLQLTAMRGSISHTHWNPHPL